MTILDIGLLFWTTLYVARRNEDAFEWRVTHMQLSAR